MEDILKKSSQDTSNPTDVNPNEHVSATNSSQLAGAEYESTSTNPEDLDSRWLRWKCLNCGYVYEGVKELKKCPRCGNENPDLFEDAQ